MKILFYLCSAIILIFSVYKNYSIFYGLFNFILQTQRFPE
jgi:hypothetical protein